jgi:CubicO group peptidase (beta-lactamase class C family)
MMPRRLADLALERRVAALMAPCAARPGTPGWSVGVVRDGALALHAHVGLASVEHGVPIGPETRFRIASVTKQFTCAAILLLAQEGRLSVEDDVCAHLPDLPEWAGGARVTLDHLMRNCSGLRDVLELMRMGGADLSLPCRREDLLAAIRRSARLNFAPGTRFLYSNTNFLLLGLVVERVAGEPLGAFLERRIFAPLGMTRTCLTESTAEAVPGLATGYLAAGEGFLRAPHAFPLGGEGGLVSCVEDLALWERNFAAGIVGGAALGEALLRQAPFANGRMNKYARGLEVTQYRGLRTAGHGGLWPGYKTCFLRVPERALAVIAIANHGGLDIHHLAHQVLDAALEGALGVHPLPALPPRGTPEHLTGRWLDREAGATLELWVDAATGDPMARMHGVPFALAPTGDGRLTARRGAFEFTLTPGEDAIEIEADAGQIATFHRVATEGATLPAGLPGRYACAELGAAWTIGTDHALHVAGPLVRAGPCRLEPVEGEVFRAHLPGTLFPTWFDVRARRDAAGRVTALVVSGARARDLLFNRED